MLKKEILCEHPMVHVARTQEDYFKMFSCETDNCMTYRHNMAFPVAREFIKRGLFCGDWYGYNPHTQGVWLESDEGVVLSRNILLRENTKEPFSLFFEDFPSANWHYGKMFKELLSDLGYEPYEKWQLTIQEKFRIPAYDLKGELYCPLPFHDAVNTKYYIAFYEDTNEFEFGPLWDKPKDRPIIAEHITYKYNGFVNSKLLS